MQPWGLVWLVLMLPPVAALAAGPDAAGLMEKSRQTTLLKGSRTEFKLELRLNNGSARVRRVITATRLQPNGVRNSRISRFEFPPDAKGLATLLIERDDGPDDVWVYVPALKRTRRVVAEGKRDSFMGTVLSYGDVIGHKPTQWGHRIVGKGSWEGQPCWLVESVPINESVRSESGYSKRVSCIDVDTAFSWKMEVWDLAGKLLKSIMNRKVKAVPEQPNVFVAYEIEARNLQTGESSILSVESFRFVPNLPEAEFMPNALGDDS